MIHVLLTRWIVDFLTDLRRILGHGWLEFIVLLGLEVTILRVHEAAQVKGVDPVEGLSAALTIGGNTFIGH